MWKGLRNNNASVEGELPAAIFGRVFVAVERLSCIKGHGDAGFRCDTPAIEEPFDRDFEVAYRCVGVNKDDKLVLLKEGVENVRLHPCVVHSLHVVRVDEAVVVAVYLRCTMSVLQRRRENRKLVRTVKEVVHKGRADHTTIALRLHRLPVQTVFVPQLILLVGYPSIDVHNQYFAPKWFSPPWRIFFHFVYFSRRVGIRWIVYGVPYGFVEPEEGVADRRLAKNWAVVVADIVGCLLCGFLNLLDHLGTAFMQPGCRRNYQNAYDNKHTTDDRQFVV